MPASFRITQEGLDNVADGVSRFDLAVNAYITLEAVDPAPADGVRYEWEIIDRAGTSSALTANTGDAVSIEEQATAPFAFLVEMRAYVNEALVGKVRRPFGARTPVAGLRLPLFSETADPAATISARNLEASTDNSLYEDRAGTGVSERNWRGWAEFLHELVLAVEDGGGPPFVPTQDLGQDDGGQLVVGIHGRPISDANPEDGQGLVWNDSLAQWEPGAVSGEAGAPVFSGDVELGEPEDDIIPTAVVALQGRAVGDTAPEDGQALLWSDGLSRWEPGTVAGGAEQLFVGDVDVLPEEDGYRATTVVALVNQPLSGVAPSVGQVLGWNEDGMWTPVDPAGGGGGSGDVEGPGSATAGSLAAFSDGTHIIEAGLSVSSGNLVLGGGKTVDGRDVSVDGAKLDLIESGAQVTSAARVLTALAAAAGDVSVNTHKITNVVDPTNPQDVATRAYVLANVGGGWKTYCDFNFTQMANQTIVQGVNTIDGIQMRADNVSLATTFSIISGTGLYIKNTTANSTFYYTVRNAPMLFVDLPADIPGWFLDISEVRISCEWNTIVATANFSCSGFGIAKQPFVTNQELTAQFWHQYTSGMRRAIARLYTTTEASPTITSTYNTGMLHFKSQHEHEWWAKNNAAADTTANSVVLNPATMTHLGTTKEQPGAGVTTAPLIANRDHFIAMWTGHSDNTLGNAEHVCKRMRIEYKL
jgi:hypothetical protein